MFFIDRMKKEIEDLKAKLQLALTELTKAKTVVEQERSENSELTSRVLELEQMLDDMSKTCDSKDLNMTEMEDKVKELEKMLTDKSVVEEELEESKRRTSQLEGMEYYFLRWWKEREREWFYVGYLISIVQG